MVIETRKVAALRFPLLLIVADRDYVADDTRWLEIVRQLGDAARGEAAALQVRAKGAPRDELRLLAARARAVVPPEVPLTLNGDAALAASLGYDGGHWPEAETPAGETPRGNLRWRSAAVHSVEAIRGAERAGADLLVFGSVFEPGSKPGVASGLEALRAAVRATALPVVAIGGITPERVAACLAAGARGIAVVSGVLGAASPVAAMRAYLDALAVHAVPAVNPVQEGELR